MKRKVKRFIALLAVFVLAFSALAFLANVIAHGAVFRRADSSEYDARRYVTYSDADSSRYPRTELTIPGAQNELTAYLYGESGTKGLIVITPGHRDSAEIKLYETLYFVDAGWQVLCFDLTGCYTSGGADMGGYTQSVRDLDDVLGYIERAPRFDGLRVMLFGHSLGAYASCAVLESGHELCGVVAASGFDTPAEQWRYSIERYTGPASFLVCPFAKLYASLKYRSDAQLSAVEGINSVDIPVLVISGTQDEYYGGVSPIYLKKDSVTNPQCVFLLEQRENHSGHYDYFLSDRALDYHKTANSLSENEPIDKWLYMEHDSETMERICAFFDDALAFAK